MPLLAIVMLLLLTKTCIKTLNKAEIKYKHYMKRLT